MQQNGSLADGYLGGAAGAVIASPSSMVHTVYAAWWTGLQMLQCLNMLEAFPISEMGHNTAKTLHTVIEAGPASLSCRSSPLSSLTSPSSLLLCLLVISIS